MIQLKINRSFKYILFFTNFLASYQLNAANLLFKSNFGSGSTLSDPYGIITNPNGGGVAWQKLNGVDSETGFDWSSNILGSTFNGLQIITMDSVNSTTISDHALNVIRQVIGPSGRPINELYINLKKKCDAGPVPDGVGPAQIPLLIKRPYDIGDINNLYISYWFKHQPNLADSLDNTISSGAWRSQFEFKTGGYNGDLSSGDYRLKVMIKEDTNGLLYWQLSGDNGANPPLGTNYVLYWSLENKTVPVPIGKWFRFELFWHRAKGSNGRYWAAVNGQVIGDFVGPENKILGAAKLPITRIMPVLSYSGGWPEIKSEMTGLEIWDGFPCGTGISCHDKIPPTVSVSGVTEGSNVSGNVTINAQTSDNVAVTKVNLIIDGKYSDTDLEPPYSFTWDSRGVINGPHKIALRAFDSSGNSQLSTAVNVNVNNANP